MLESVLIANRGEIARRIIRTARRLGVRCIAVHSQADRHAAFVREADESVELGGSAPAESYLNIARILAAARQARAAAIHPGYGFLSENAQFATAVEAAGMTWVGPPAAAIRAMGRKDAAKRLMQEHGVPVTPGYLGDEQSSEHLAAEAVRVGYPVMIKAIAGGGGRGMRRVAAPADFAEALASCQREATAAFGDGSVLLERCIDVPRHVEVQVFADSRGQIVHLFERDCSVQRHHQKIIEEAPAPGMDEATRAALCGAAVAAARAVGYVGAGTVEFIADVSQGLRADRIWFMEMNTRLQVEHPVTEMITGVDLVEWQLRIASGEALPCRQEDLRIEGWAMEARLYAENPERDYLPSSGTLEHLALPAQVRVDSGVDQGDVVSGHYDALLAKLIVHAPDRQGAAERLERACAATEVWPVKCNAALLARIAALPDFTAGRLDTHLIERHAAELLKPVEPSIRAQRCAAAALRSSGDSDPWEALHGWRSGAAPNLSVSIEIGAEIHTVLGEHHADVRLRAIGAELVLFEAGAAWRCQSPTLTHDPLGQHDSDGTLRAPMPGRIASVMVRSGDAVRRGQRLVVLEAMKMEHALSAPFDGVVAEVAANVGDQVSEGFMLAIVRPEAP